MLTKEQQSLLLYLETCVVDQPCLADSAKLNLEDMSIIEEWNRSGYIKFARFPSRWLSSAKGKSLRTYGVAHQVRLSEAAMADAHKLRAERAARMASAARQKELLGEYYEKAQRMLNSEAYKKDVPKRPPITSFLGAVSDIVHVDIGEVKTKKSILAKDDEKLGD